MEESKGISSQFVGNLSGRGGQASVTDQAGTVIILRSSDPIIQHAVSDAVKTMKYFGFLRKNTSAKGQKSKHSDLEGSLNMRASYAEPTEQPFPSSPKAKTAKKMFSPAPKYAKPQSKFEPFVQERDSLGHLLPVQSRHNKRTALSTLEMSSAYNLQKNTSFLEMASILEGPKLRLGSKYFQLNPDANLRLKAHIAACRDNSPVIQFQTTKPVDSLLKSNDVSNKQRLSLQTTPTKKRHKSEISLHALIPREDSVSSKKLVVHSPQVESDSKAQVRRLLDYSSSGNFKTEPKKGSIRFQSIVTRSFDATGEGGLVLKLPDHSIHQADPIQNEISFKPIHAFSPSRKSKSNAPRQIKGLTRSELTMREHGEESGSVSTPRSVEASVDADTSIKPAETLGDKLPDIRSHDKPYRHSIVEATRTQPSLAEKQGSGDPDSKSVHNLGMAQRQGGSGEPSLTSVTHLTSSAAKVVIIPRKQSLSKFPEATPVMQSPFLHGQVGTPFTQQTMSVELINAYFSNQERLRAEVKNTTNYVMKEPSQATIESKSIGFKLLNMEKDSPLSTPIDAMTSKDLEYIQSEASRKPSLEVQEVRAYRNLGLIPMLTPLELEHVTRARVKGLGRVVTRENIEDRKKRQLGKSKADLNVSQVDFKGKANILA